MDSFTEDLNSPLPKQMQSEMMDDVRPLSLTTNDCAASNARRIEGRPGTALQPSFERVGGITLKHGTLAIASKMVSSSEDPFRNLSDHILEHILARLPRLPLKAAKKVCKRWTAVTSTPDFDILHNELNPKPRLFRFGMRPLSPSDTQCLTYDVENNAWVKLPALQFPAHTYDTLTGASGVVFAIGGPGKDRLLYKLTSSASSAESFGETWYETPVATFPRWSPVVSVALGTGRGHKVVVAGGRADYCAVEVFDSEMGTWESYGDLPEECKAWTWISGVVCDNKFYVASLYKSEIDEVRIHCVDLFTKQWATIQLERPDYLVYHHIMAIDSTLVVAGYLAGSDREHPAVKLWKVDLEILSLIEIGLMPSEMSDLIKGPPAFVSFRVLVDENLVYIILVDGEIVMGEVSLEECKTCWRRLPPHLGTRSVIAYEGFITFSAYITSAQLS